jgi:hypothetical protein
LLNARSSAATLVKEGARVPEFSGHIVSGPNLESRGVLFLPDRSSWKQPVERSRNAKRSAVIPHF